MRFRRAFSLLFAVVLAGGAARQFAQDASVSFVVVGDWDVKVKVPDAKVAGVIHVTPPSMVHVTAEEYKSIPLFNPKAGGWVRGAQLLGVKAQETTSPGLLDGGSFTLRSGPSSDSMLFQRGMDYEVDTDWGTFGRLPGSRISPDQPVFASYNHAALRLDAVVLGSDGKIRVRQGQPRAAAPAIPNIGAGERHLGNIYISGFIPRLGPDHMFPVLERAYPERRSKEKAGVITRVERRLRAGQGLRILAWGDSVTDGRYLSDS